MAQRAGKRTAPDEDGVGSGGTPHRKKKAQPRMNLDALPGPCLALICSKLPGSVLDVLRHSKVQKLMTAARSGARITFKKTLSQDVEYGEDFLKIHAWTAFLEVCDVQELEHAMNEIQQRDDAAVLGGTGPDDPLGAATADATATLANSEAAEEKRYLSRLDLQTAFRCLPLFRLRGASQHCNCEECTARYLRMFTLLFKHPSVSVTTNDNHALRMACQSGAVSVVRALFTSAREDVDPTADNNYPLRIAAEYGFSAIVDYLLALNPDKGVNPSALNSYALRKACANGYHEITSRLLQWQGPPARSVNPAALYNAPIRLSAKYGHLSIVKMLIRDPRVDPSVNQNYALREAARFGHHEVVQFLMMDPRVDPHDMAGAAMREARAQNHEEVIQVLDKVSPPLVPSQ